MTSVAERLSAALSDRYRIERELGEGGAGVCTRPRGDAPRREAGEHPHRGTRSSARLPHWAPDGETLYYGRSVGRAFFAARVRADPVPSVTSIDSLFAEPGLGAIPSLGAMHPGGDRFIFAVYAGGGTPNEHGSERGRLILVQNYFTELRARVSH